MADPGPLTHLESALVHAFDEVDGSAVQTVERILGDQHREVAEVDHPFILPTVGLADQSKLVVGRHRAAFDADTEHLQLACALIHERLHHFAGAVGECQHAVSVLGRQAVPDSLRGLSNRQYPHYTGWRGPVRCPPSANASTFVCPPGTARPTPET